MHSCNCRRAAMAAAAISAVLVLASCSRHLTAASDIGRVYQVNCSGCHAADASGNSPAAKLLKVRDLRSAEVQKKTDQELAQIIGKGTSNMPGFEKSLGQGKVRALVAYLRELARKQRAVPMQ